MTGMAGTGTVCDLGTRAYTVPTRHGVRVHDGLAPNKYAHLRAGAITPLCRNGNLSAVPARWPVPAVYHRSKARLIIHPFHIAWRLTSAYSTRVPSIWGIPSSPSSRECGSCRSFTSLHASRDQVASPHPLIISREAQFPLRKIKNPL